MSARAHPLPADRSVQPLPAQPASLASRWRQRLFPPWASRDGAAPAPPPAGLPEPVAKRQLGFQAGMAEFLLVNRLHARLRAVPCADVLERASRIVFVTCKNWFGAAQDGQASSAAAPARPHPRHRTRL